MYGKGELDLNTPEPKINTIGRVLELVSEEEIISKYLGIDNIVSGKSYLSPLREEKRPSCVIKKVNDRIRFYDYGGGFRGDVFDILCILYQKELPDVIEMVAKDHKFNRTGKIARKIKNHIPAEMHPKIRPYGAIDEKYWRQYYVSNKTLSLYRIYPLENLYMERDGNSFPLYVYTGDNPAYCYLFFDNDGNEKYKFYFPTRSKKSKKPRFLGNVTDEIIQGYDQLPEKGDLLVITKSMKDVMVFHELNIPAIAPQGEGMEINPYLIGALKRRFRVIVSNYDYDRQGKMGAAKLRKCYGIQAYMFDDTYPVKDVSDYVHKYSLEHLKTLIQDERNRYNNQAD